MRRVILETHSSLDGFVRGPGKELERAGAATLVDQRP